MSQGWGGVIIHNPRGCANLVSNKSESYRLSSKVMAMPLLFHALHLLAYGCAASANLICASQKEKLTRKSYRCPLASCTELPQALFFQIDLLFISLQPLSNMFLTHSFGCQELEPVVGVIVAQIRALFGLPPMFVKNFKTNTYGVPAAVTGIADWFAA